MKKSLKHIGVLPFQAFVGAFVLWASVVNTAHSEDYPVKLTSAVERIDDKFDELVPQGAKVEQLADGFKWTEGPVWVKTHGFLLFSDIPNNRINVFKEGKGVWTYLKNSGYTGQVKFTGEEPGTNGLFLDPNGFLTMCEHGNRRVTRLNSDRTRTLLATHYQGRRFNSPNDLVWHSNGDLYFTDPPYGLPKRYEQTPCAFPFRC